MTPLHLAVKAGSLKTVNVLTNCFLPSTLEEKNHEGNTPLHLACKYNRLDVLQFLLDRGADVTVRNQGDMTCLDVAIEWEAEEVAKTLVKHQRYVYMRTNNENVFSLISTEVSIIVTIIIIIIIIIISVYFSCEDKYPARLRPRLIQNEHNRCLALCCVLKMACSLKHGAYISRC